MRLAGTPLLSQSIAIATWHVRLGLGFFLIGDRISHDQACHASRGGTDGDVILEDLVCHVEGVGGPGLSRRLGYLGLRRSEVLGYGLWVESICRGNNKT